MQSVFSYVDSDEDESKEVFDDELSHNNEVWNMGSFIIKRVVVTFLIYGIG